MPEPLSISLEAYLKQPVLCLCKESRTTVLVNSIFTLLH